MSSPEDHHTPNRDDFFERYSQEELLHALDMVSDEHGVLPEELAEFQPAYDQFTLDADERSEYRQVLQLREHLMSATPYIFITPALVALNIILFVAMVAMGVDLLSPEVKDLIQWGANYGPRTLADEPWRLITCTFLHIGLIHIAMNMFVLWQVGKILERLTGNMGFLVLYLGSGVIASLVSVYTNTSIVSAGASGAVFGTFGGLLAFLYRNSDGGLEIFKPLVISISKILVLNLILGIVIPGIDMAAHVGGLVAGLLLGAVLRRSVSSQSLRGRSLRNAAAIGVALGVILAGIQLAPSAPVDTITVVKKAKQLENDINATAAEMRTWVTTAQGRINQLIRQGKTAESQQLASEQIDHIEATWLPRWRALDERVNTLAADWPHDATPFAKYTDFIEGYRSNLNEYLQLLTELLPEETARLGRASHQET